MMCNWRIEKLESGQIIKSVIVTQSLEKLQERYDMKVVKLLPGITDKRPPSEESRLARKETLEALTRIARESQSEER
jgi:hypothetical protein